jgi:ABC-type nitrate/sulfonate/bicarbonate transport system substrate-binding protein
MVLGLVLCSFDLASAQQRRKILVAYVAPGMTQAIPWITKEAGIFAKRAIDAEVILLTGSPRIIQTLIAGDIDYAVGGTSSVLRARMRGAIRLFWQRRRTSPGSRSCFVPSLPFNACKT